MGIGVSIHKVILNEKTIVEPNQTYDFGKQFDELVNVDAVRAATPAEHAAYNKSVEAAKAAEKTIRDRSAERAPEPSAAGKKSADEKSEI